MIKIVIVLKSNNDTTGSLLDNLFVLIIDSDMFEFSVHVRLTICELVTICDILFLINIPSTSYLLFLSFPSTRQTPELCMPFALQTKTSSSLRHSSSDIFLSTLHHKWHKHE